MAAELVPDTRKHRGMHPKDAELFGPLALPGLRAATADLSLLLGRGYTLASSLALVGNRYTLSARQRAAIARCACAVEVAHVRAAHMLAAPALRDATLLVDGFNVLTTLEVALSGGVVLVARDGTLRDIAGVHGSYRTVQETVPALAALAGHLRALGVRLATFLLDRPVSNSGRLRALIEDHAGREGWPFAAEVVEDPDALLAASDEIVASADGAVLDRCSRAYNLARECVRAEVKDARVVDLSGAPEASP